MKAAQLFLLLIKILVASGGSLVALNLMMRIITSVDAHGNGAPLSRCGSMTPGHWVTPQQGPSPYQITLDTAILPEGSQLSINITAVDGDTTFKGFLIMITKVNDTGDNADLDIEGNFGRFDLLQSDIHKIQPLSCFGNKASAVTHQDNVEKQFLHVVWTAPNLQPEQAHLDLEIRVTVVQNFWTIWRWTTINGFKKIRITKSHEQVSIGNKRPNMDSNQTSTIQFIERLPNNERDLEDDERDNHGSNDGTVQALDGNASWEHFRRAWLYVLNMLGFKKS